MYYVIIMLKNEDHPLVLSFSTLKDAESFVSSSQKSCDIITTIIIDKDKTVNEVYTAD